MRLQSRADSCGRSAEEYTINHRQRDTPPDAPGPGTRRTERGRVLLTWGCALLALVLGLFGLDNDMYWDDEANTAFIGRNFMREGSFSAWDGRNLMSHGMQAGISTSLQKSGHPPLQYVVAGLSQSLFGDSNAGGRLLFVILGALAVAVTAFWYRREFDAEHYWVAALFLALSVPYLLYIRNVRHHAPGLLTCVGLLWSWSLVRHGRPKLAFTAGAACFLLAATAQYLMLIATLSVMLASLLRPAHRTRRHLHFLGMLGAIGLLCSVALYFYSPATLQLAWQLLSERMAFNHLRRITALGLKNICDHEFVPLGAFAFGLLIVWRGDRDLRRRYLANAGLLGLYLVVSVYSTALMERHWTIRFPHLVMRHFILLIPLGAVLAAWTFEALRQLRPRFLHWGFAGVLLGSNVLTLNVFMKDGFHVRLLEYARENADDHVTQYEGIAAFLTEEVGEEDCVFMTPMHTNIVFMYYFPDYRFCGLVSERAPFVEHNQGVLRDDLFFERVAPEYFFISHTPARAAQDKLDYAYGPGSYRYIKTLPYHWRNAIRPELPFRHFGRVPLRDLDREGIQVFRHVPGGADRPRVNAEIGRRLFR